MDFPLGSSTSPAGPFSIVVPRPRRGIQTPFESCRLPETRSKRRQTHRNPPKRVVPTPKIMQNPPKTTQHLSKTSVEPLKTHLKPHRNSLDPQAPFNVVLSSTTALSTGSAATPSSVARCSSKPWRGRVTSPSRSSCRSKALS